MNNCTLKYSLKICGGKLPLHIESIAGKPSVEKGI